MRSVGRTFSGLFLAALLLAWSCVGPAGLISYCAGDGDQACGHGLVHVWTTPDQSLPAESLLACGDKAPCRDQTPAPPDGKPAMAEDHCSCPPDHRHEVASLETSLPPMLTMMLPLWKEFLVWPQPPKPPERGICLDRPVALAEAWPPGSVPLHLSQAPLLI